MEHLAESGLACCSVEEDENDGVITVVWLPIVRNAGDIHSEWLIGTLIYTIVGVRRR